MTGETSSLDRIEFTLIGVFKVILVIALCMALAATAYFGIRGSTEYATTAEPSPSRKSPPAEKFEQTDLLRSLAPKPAETAGDAAPSQEKLKEDPSAEKKALEAQIQALWKAVDAYQHACGQASPVTQDQFSEGLRQSRLGAFIVARGASYADSQVKFVQQSLSNPEVVALCKQGKEGLFFNILNFHLKQWDEHQKAVDDFNNAETERIRAMENAESQRVLEARASGYQKLMIAVSAFGAFMALAMLLIFARIESNLRGVRRA